jgi:leukotriene-A4 hydrolase
MERVLQQFLHSPAHRSFSYLIGNEALRDALEEYKDRPKYQRLVIDFEEGEDPDDAYSSVPYEKGANFILHIGNDRWTLMSLLRLIISDRTNAGGT